jgi:hypothetical protein
MTYSFERETHLPSLSILLNELARAQDDPAGGSPEQMDQDPAILAMEGAIIYIMVYLFFLSECLIGSMTAFILLP